MTSTNDEEEVPKNLTKLQKVIPGIWKYLDASKYKTELCKEFQIQNYCKYGAKCKFAHGREELNKKINSTKFKSKLCKSYYNQGFCRYG